jgi:hypothetical protein
MKCDMNTYFHKYINTSPQIYKHKLALVIKLDEQIESRNYLRNKIK